MQLIAQLIARFAPGALLSLEGRFRQIHNGTILSKCKGCAPVSEPDQRYAASRDTVLRRL